VTACFVQRRSDRFASRTSRMKVSPQRSLQEREDCDPGDRFALFYVELQRAALDQRQADETARELFRTGTCRAR
jgi:hypothetical protein